MSSPLAPSGGGVVGAATIASKKGVPDVLTLDMGGTSTDVSLVEDGTPGTTRQTKVGYREFKSRSVDVNTVGAGGGSIARVQLSGALQVGPESAGADPGPACYGQGGEEPTVTDANVVLGWVDPDKFLGGDMDATAAPAREVIQPERYPAFAAALLNSQPMGFYAPAQIVRDAARGAGLLQSQMDSGLRLAGGGA